IRTKKRSPCVIVDNTNGGIGRCNSTISLISLSQLVGTWEIELTSDESLDLTELGVCSSHFNFDHKQLHSHKTKALRHFSKSVVHTKKCLLRNGYKKFFSRGRDCIEHCWNICGRDIQVPCLGLKSCPAFQKIQNISSMFTNDDRYVRYICTKYFENHGGHLHIRSGPGRKPQTCVYDELHIEDTNLVLRLFSNWLLNLSYSQNENKEKILRHMMKLLETPESRSSFLIDTEFYPPSPLFVKIAMKIHKFDGYSPTEKNL
ncbi:32420_t:CDS:1, partial [Racocetra persica]